ncbi:unnamed protein product [Closterium sp. NIES-53]
MPCWFRTFPVTPSIYYQYFCFLPLLPSSPPPSYHPPPSLLPSFLPTSPPLISPLLVPLPTSNPGTQRVELQCEGGILASEAVVLFRRFYNEGNLNGQLSLLPSSPPRTHQQQQHGQGRQPTAVRGGHTGRRGSGPLQAFLRPKATPTVSCPCSPPPLPAPIASSSTTAGSPLQCEGGILASEAVDLFRRFYEQGNPNAPRPHRPIKPGTPGAKNTTSWT